MTAADEWLEENAIECTRYRLRLSPHACQACQRATPERCEGCERTKDKPQLTPRQAQHVRGALNAVKTRRNKAMAKEKDKTEEVEPVGAHRCAPEQEKQEPAPKARKIPVQGYWRGGLRQALREIAGEAVLSEADPRIVRLVRCCHYLAEQVAVRDEAGAMKVFEEASEILGR